MPFGVTLTETVQGGAGVVDNFIDMPTVVDLGDLLVSALTFSANVGSVVLPAGWNLLRFVQGSTSDIYAAAKIADGTEGGTTVNFIGGGTQGSSAHTYRITIWDGVVLPEASAGVAGPNDTAPNPDILTPSWGPAESLWFAICSLSTGLNTIIQTYPTNYLDGVQTGPAGGGGQQSIGSAQRVLNVATENPDPFGLDAAVFWSALTIAVKPSTDDTLPADPTNLVATVVP